MLAQVRAGLVGESVHPITLGVRRAGYRPAVEISLEGKVALVTGASRGIGRAIAQAYADAGASVLLSSRKLPDLEAAAAEIGGDVDVIAANAGDPDQAAAAVDRCIERFGGVDILVNNAATNPYMGPTMDIDLPRYDKTWEVNLRGALVWTQLAWKRSMRERPGSSVINVASVGGMTVEPSIGIYNATKAALIHLTRTLAMELSPSTRVNALAPGLVKTDMARALWEPNEARMGQVDPARPAGRAGRHRQRRAVPRQRPGVVDHRPHPHRRRRRHARHRAAAVVGGVPHGPPRRRTSGRPSRSSVRTSASAPPSRWPSDRDGPKPGRGRSLAVAAVVRGGPAGRRPGARRR